MAATGDKYTIKAFDSIIGAITPELRSKMLNQIPSKTKQLASNLQLAEGERTEIALNVRTDDGVTNGASNITKKITLYDKSRPSGIIWVQFDHVDVGEKTRTITSNCICKELNLHGLLSNLSLHNLQ